MIKKHISKNQGFKKSSKIKHREDKSSKIKQKQ